MSSTSSAKKLISLVDTIVFFISIFILIIGLFGNSLNIIIFTLLRSYRTKPCGYYFLIESLVNLSQIFFGLISYIVENRLNIDGSIDSLVWCKIRTTVIQSLNMIFISIVCSVSFDQFLATHYTYSIRQMSTKNLAKNNLLFSLCLMVIHMIIALIFFEIRPPYVGCIIYNSITANYFTCFFYPVLIGLLPIIITINFSLLAFYNTRRLVRRQIPTERRQFDQQLTAMTFARVIAYVSFSLPYIIFRIYSVKRPIQTDDLREFAINYFIGSITGSWAYVNYVISFYVFLISSPRFRHKVKHLLTIKCWRAVPQRKRTISHRIIGNQIVPEPNQPSISTIRLN